MMLHPADAPLSGINLIEASAGTGKTFTIALLYLRMIVERGLMPADILVVTYTKAATAELRDRIWKLLKRLQQLLEQDDGSAPFLTKLIQQSDDLGLLQKRLNLALATLDEAAIYTIHGFCQRAIADFAFESALDFEAELVPDNTPVIRQLVEDFWRNETAKLSALSAERLMQAKFTPQALRKSLLGVLSKSQLSLVALPALDVSAVEREFQQLFIHAKSQWQLNGDACAGMIKLAIEANHLKKTRYKADKISVWAEELRWWFARSDASVLLPKSLEYFGAESLKQFVMKGADPLEHGLFDCIQQLLAASEQLALTHHSMLNGLRLHGYQYLLERMPVELAARRMMGFEDLLKCLHAALHSGQGGVLAKALQQRYQAALIDEFQDTDPLQYAIFKSIYSQQVSDVQAIVFLVGDPKQAIYGFRGADIFAYLEAQKDAETHYQLQVNYRSTPALIAATNALFSRPKPFLYDEIEYSPVVAPEGRNSVLTTMDDPHAPMRLWILPDDAAQGSNKETLKNSVAAATATEIARLLNQSARGQATINEQAVLGGDIAVLVRDRFEAQAMRQALNQRKIASVLLGQESVFASPEARVMLMVMRALATPQRGGLIRAALTSELFARKADALANLMHEDMAWDAEVESFLKWHTLWSRHGFSLAWNTLMMEVNAAATLLAQAEGERKLANYQHLAELLHVQDTTHGFGMQGLLRYLNDAIADANENPPEGHLLRLESDAHLVNIVTIHKSKGLEYPIVFCPFTWTGRNSTSKTEIAVYHADQQTYADFGSDQFDQALLQTETQEFAESLRLLYVAVTRAKERCTLIWGAGKELANAALGWLLHGQSDESLSVFKARLSGMDTSQIMEDCLRLQALAPDAILVSTMPVASDDVFMPVHEQAPVLRAQVLSLTIAPPRFMTSFSRISAPFHQSYPESSFGNIVEDAQDYDLGIPETESDSLVASKGEVYAFPAGAQAGTCLHWMLEQIDFQNPTDWSAIVTQGLRLHGLSADWQSTALMLLRNTTQTALNASGLSLAQISPASRIVELAFHYPVARPVIEPVKAYVAASKADLYALDALSGLTEQGTMKGFVDLVFEWQGRFYIIDYKSNLLGQSSNFYAAAFLRKAMVSSAYPLQYLIYTVALHRYLQTRLPNYDYDQHMGGSYYLFLRGMRPEEVGSGVFYDLPDRDLIECLDHALRIQ